MQEANTNFNNILASAPPPPPVPTQRNVAPPPPPIPTQRNVASPPPPVPTQRNVASPPPPIPIQKEAKQKQANFNEKIKDTSQLIQQKIDNINKDEVIHKTKNFLKIAIEWISKIYIVVFFRRLFKKNNIGTIIFLILNVGLYIWLLGGFYMPELIPTAVLLYLISLTIALSPIGEFIVRMQSGCKKLKKFKNQQQAQRLQALFDEVYSKARHHDPTISPKVKIFLSKDKDINAFATGRKTVCATQGLLQLSDEEIKGILGHEFGHLAHKDTDLLLVILVSNLLLSILFIIIRIVASIFIFLIGEGERSFGGIFNLIVRLLVDFILVLAIRLWTKIGVLLVMHSSRQNEFEADKFSCELSYGYYLANALNTIDGNSQNKDFWANLRSSHPDTVDRIERIQQWMTNNEYQPIKLNSSASSPCQSSKPPMGMAAAVPPLTRPKPKQFVRTENILVNSLCYGRSSTDGRMYFGQISNIQDGYADFLFYDNSREWVPLNCIVTIKDAWEQLKPFGNCQNKGLYYPCTIQKSAPDGCAIVQYDNNKFIETVSKQALTFICPPNM